ncbi:protein ABHD1-like [Ornithodoros turicata]|uniref:protein ABHD1-like n=1 Tax=Ornithodoros turicata TaxID=34597 RepID=UPI00313A45D0
MSLTVIVCCATTIYLFYYAITSLKKPRLICRHGPFRDFLTSRCPFINDKLLPTPWCFTSNGQSIVAILLQEFRPQIAYDRQILFLSDGGEAALDWFVGGTDSHSPTVLFTHGITGDSQSYYLKVIVPMVQSIGCRCAVFNQRGCGGVPLKTARIQSCINTDDLGIALDAIKRRYPSGPILAVGYSMGGIVICQYLSQQADNSLIDAAITVSTPTDIHAASESLNSFGFNRVVNYYIARKLVNFAERNRSVLEPKVNFEQVIQAKTIRQFDSCCTAVVLGFNNVDEYYEAASIRRKLGTVRRPLLFLMSTDDIFVLDTTPIREIESSVYLGAVLLPRGGHIGFVDGFLWPWPPFYAERFVYEYVKTLVKFSMQRSLKMLPQEFEGQKDAEKT